MVIFMGDTYESGVVMGAGFWFRGMGGVAVEGGRAPNGGA